MKKLIYKVLGLFYRNGVQTTISEIPIKLPFRFSRYYEKDYETDNVQFFRQSVKANDIVLDIGAQVGLMSKLFADLVGSKGKVYAFEPTPFTFGVLKTTIRINHLASTVFPVQEAVSDKKGTARFNVSDKDLDASNSLSDFKRSNSITGIEVKVTSVDEFVKERSITKVNFIKIDAEGAEYFVLLGAKNTMTSYRPIINLALHPEALRNFNSSLKEIFNFVTTQNYSVIFKSKTLTEKEFVAHNNLFDVQLLPN